MTELRVYLLIEDLRPQFAAYMGTPTRARGYPPLEGSNSLIIEVAPALAIQRVMDLAVKTVPEIEAGILFVERQFGVLELHGYDLAELMRAGQAVLEKNASCFHYAGRYAIDELTHEVPRSRLHLRAMRRPAPPARTDRAVGGRVDGACDLCSGAVGKSDVWRAG